VGEARAHATPEGVPTGVPRLRALGLVSRLAPQAVVIVAPGGYGKTVLASQIHSLDPTRALVWFSVSGRTLDISIAQGLLASVRREGPQHTEASSLMPSAGLPEALALVDAVVAASPGKFCLVLDDVGRDVDPDAAEVVRLLLRRGCQDSMLVVTSRFVDARVLAGADSLILETSDLAFSEDEAHNAIVRVLGSDVESAVTREIWSAASGQPAIVNVLAKHMSLRDGVWRPQEAASLGVTVLLQELAGQQLTDAQMDVLRAMAWVGAGDLSHLSGVIGHDVAPCDVQAIAAAVPLVRVDACSGGRIHSFRTHGIAQEVFGRAPDSVEGEAQYSRVIELLASDGDFARSCELLLRSSTSQRTVEWLEEYGSSAIKGGGSHLLEEAIERVPPSIAVGSTRLMLLRAELAHDAGRLEEAYRWAIAAKDIAAHDGDGFSAQEASIRLARLQTELGNHVLAARHLEDLRSDGPARLDSETQVLAAAYLALSYAALGDSASSQRHAGEGRGMLDANQGIGVAVQANARQVLSIANVVQTGRWNEAAVELRMLADWPSAPPVLRVQARGNLAACLVEMGRNSAALEHARSAIDASRRYGLSTVVASIEGTMSCLHAALGDQGESERTMKRALDAAEGLDVPGALSEGLVARAAIRRAVAQYGTSLEDAEAAVALAARMTFRLSSCSAHLERAASLLALGDVPAAVVEGQRIHDEVAPAGAMYLHLKADLILAEVDCRNGNTTAAVERMAEHSDYILSESPNWMLAMYIRAFPRLLGVVANAVGVSELPSHMLSMILPAYAESAISAASAVLEPRPLAALSQRLLGRKGSGRRISDLPREDVCQVRLFGGMEVITADGPVPSKAWRKRKARLLFAMLAVRRGGDVPTDQILDYLWPDFPEDKALNNMYVVWSAMKHALSPGLDRGAPCPYVERVGNVCHLVRANVTTDLDAFEDRLAEGKKADHAGDVEAAIAALRDVMEIYRGELLPGDAYDDWFRSARDRCKHEYSDAALRLACLLEARGDVPEALQVLRQALVHDAWREDLYQAVLRHQISEGQRSAAIETYINCRNRLIEDLGIDPSAETNKLYQHVLGMESNTEESKWSSAERAIYEREEFFRNRPTW
jgi:DNA-binding SARP family transcriptional activator/ATP/maltotriose-dependent transcriptional regulator MalT